MREESPDQAPRIYWISGPPAAGKSTLCRALAERFERAVHIPVDDVRGWVCRGMADSVPWTDETERQFQLAEAAVSDSARRYIQGGFNVAVDHCRNPQRLEQVIREHLQGLNVTRVCLLPELEENLRRSHTRTNKSFEPHLLDETIRYTNRHYRLGAPPGWLFVDNTALSVEETVKKILDSKLEPS